MSLSQIGEILSQERKKQSLTLKNISKKTCISIVRLEQIEKGYHDKTLAKIYIQGFIQSYAKVLNIDAQHLLKLLGSEESKKKFKLKEIKNVDKELNPLLTIVNMSLTATIIIFVGLIFWMRLALNQYELKLSKASVSQVDVNRFLEKKINMKNLTLPQKWSILDEGLVDFWRGTIDSKNLKFQRELSSVFPLKNNLKSKEENEAKEQNQKEKLKKTSAYFKISNND